MLCMSHSQFINSLTRVTLQEWSVLPDSLSKNKTTGPKWSHLCWTHVTKIKLSTYLIAISASPRNVILNQSIWNFLVSSSVVIPSIDPSHPPKKDVVITLSFACPPLSIKTFHFVWSSELLSNPWMWCCPIPESLDKTNWVLKFTQWICFSTHQKVKYFDFLKRYQKI